MVNHGALGWVAEQERSESEEKEEEEERAARWYDTDTDEVVYRW